MPSKVEHVKSWFENPDKYLGRRRFDIQVRIETVQEFTKDESFDRVLDVGCGDGSISLPLLNRSKQITLLDLSANMLAIARDKIPPDRANDVKLINSSFLDANLESRSFDLILCIGVLAHVDSPRAVIAEIDRIAKPGACVIVEFTDSSHLWGMPDLLYQKVMRVVRPAPYSTNRLNNEGIVQLLHENGLHPVGVYRYGLPPAGTHKIARQDQMYRLTRFLFGASNQNRNKWMGNEFIYCLEKR
jgi:ubiquinone/menaquinone biosynthesis C-methylase UbiE